MNYLAHLLLSDGTAPSLVGNLMGDFVKGRDAVEALPPGIREGVWLHRRVDSFTDTHPVVHRSVRRIFGRWKHFSGVIIDVYYDHLLAAGWPDYSPVSLTTFVGRAHLALLSHLHRMPAEMRTAVCRLIWHDRLRSYTTECGVYDALASIAERVRRRMPRHAVPLQESLADLRRHRAGLEEDFREFFPQLRRFAEAERAAAAPALTA